MRFGRVPRPWRRNKTKARARSIEGLLSAARSKPIHNYFEDNILVIRREQFFSTNICSTFQNWGKFGVALISNICNALTDSFLIGLQNLHPPVQIWVLPSVETSLRAGFSCFYSSLEFSPVGVNPQFIRAYWGKRSYLSSRQWPLSVLMHLGAACDSAVKSNLIDRNPFTGMPADIRVGKGEKLDINPFSPVGNLTRIFGNPNQRESID